MVVRSILGIGPASGRQYYKVTVSQSHWLSPISPYPEWSLAVALHWEWIAIDLLHKSHNAPVSHPTMHHFVTEMCTFLLQNDALWYICLMLHALWDLWDWSIALSLKGEGELIFEGPVKIMTFVVPQSHEFHCIIIKYILFHTSDTNRYYLMHIKIRYWMRLISFHLKMLDIACGLLTISSNF